jgi:hypothetical protein
MSEKLHSGYGFYNVDKYNIGVYIDINNNNIKIKNMYPLLPEYSEKTHVFYLVIGYNKKQIIASSVNIYNLSTDIVGKINEIPWDLFKLTHFELYICIYTPYDMQYHIVSIPANDINNTILKSKL